MPSTSTSELTPEEIATLIEALDSHVYWQIAQRGDRLPVHNGAVWQPGDYDGPGDSDPYWSEPAQQRDEVTKTAIREACQVRRLEAKLRWRGLLSRATSRLAPAVSSRVQ